MGHRGASPARRGAGWVLTVVGAALGALIIGEYEFAGFTPYLSGALLALLTSEVQTTLARDRGTVPAAVLAALVAAAMFWAGWISSGRGVSPFPATAWGGAALGAAVAFAWVRGDRRPGRDDAERDGGDAGPDASGAARDGRAAGREDDARG